MAKETVATLTARVAQLETELAQALVAIEGARQAFIGLKGEVASAAPQPRRTKQLTDAVDCLYCRRTNVPMDERDHEQTASGQNAHLDAMRAAKKVARAVRK